MREVITAIREAVQADRLPVVVFDLDSTLFSTGERNLRILHEFGEAHQAEHEGLQAVIADVGPEDIGWNVQECLAGRGIGDLDLLKAVTKFWFDRFFTDEYCEIDAPTPGAAAYVEACHQEGALIYYLTGRHAGGMELGTVKSLRKHGFPFWRGRCVLHLKPSFEMADKIFKDEAMDDIRSYQGQVVATFENEPGNANLFLERFPEALHFFLETIHSPEAEAPADELIRTADFTLPKS
ncbi:MAG: HAD family hydrolase [Planctomycetota bacterium]